MGGTFDPIHIGHLILAEKAYEELALDEVWFMPSGNPPHKQNREGRASDQQRVEMVRKSIQRFLYFFQTHVIPPFFQDPDAVLRSPRSLFFFSILLQSRSDEHSV